MSDAERSMFDKTADALEISAWDRRSLEADLAAARARLDELTRLGREMRIWQEICYSCDGVERDWAALREAEAAFDRALSPGEPSGDPSGDNAAGS